MSDQIDLYMRIQLFNDGGIESRLLFVALTPLVVSAIALVAYLTQLSYNDIGSSLRLKGITIARQLGPAAQYGLLSGNIVELRRLAQTVVSQPDVSSITFYDRYALPVVSEGHPKTRLAPTSMTDGWTEPGVDGDTLVFHSKVWSSHPPLDAPHAGAIPTHPSTPLLGSLTIELSRNNATKRNHEILLLTVGSCLLVLLAAALFARRLARDISEPVIALENAIREMRAGQLSTRVRPHPAKTLRSLEDGINSMAESLEAMHRENKKALSSREVELREQYEFAEALLKAQSDAGLGMVIIDGGRINLANDAALTLLGYTLEELSRLENFTDLVVQQDSEKFLHLYHNILEDGQSAKRADVNVITRSGSVVTVAAVSFKMQRRDFQYVVILGIDVTQRKRDAERLRRAYAELEAEKETAQRASIAKSRFLAASSHDLRQPLHALSLFTAQLQERLTEQDQIGLIEQIKAAHDAMSALLNSLLDISKLDLADLTPQTQPVKLGPLLQQVAANHRQAATDKQLRLTIMPTSLWGLSDPQYLARIVSNLLANAVHYTNSGEILVGARRAGGSVRIEIWDTGIGIAPGHLPHVFQEFFQVSNPERDARKGLGLGLAIVNRLAVMLGHSITVRSRQNKGSTFGVLLLRSSPDNKVTVPAKHPGDFDARILIAIDDDSIRNLLEDMLCKWGCSVIGSNCNSLRSPFYAKAHDVMICDRPCLEKLAVILPPKDMADARLILVAADLDVDQRFLLQEPIILPTPIRPAKLRALLQHLLAKAS